jgi:hypothetical protein
MKLPYLKRLQNIFGHLQVLLLILGYIKILKSFRFSYFLPFILDFFSQNIAATSKNVKNITKTLATRQQMRAASVFYRDLSSQFCMTGAL